MILIKCDYQGVGWVTLVKFVMGFSVGSRVGFFDTFMGILCFEREVWTVL